MFKTIFLGVLFPLPIWVSLGRLPAQLSSWDFPFSGLESCAWIDQDTEVQKSDLPIVRVVIEAPIAPFKIDAVSYYATSCIMMAEKYSNGFSLSLKLCSCIILSNFFIKVKYIYYRIYHFNILKCTVQWYKVLLFFLNLLFLFFLA